MTEKERLLAVLSGEAYDRAPFIIPGGMMTMAVTEVMEKVDSFWPEAHSDAGKMVRLLKGLHDLSGIENVGVPFCMTVEAEAMGATVELGSVDCEPKVTGYAINAIDDMGRLKPITRDSARVKVLVEAVKILAVELKDTPIIANLVGPISLVTSILEPMVFLKAVKRDKAQAHRLLQLVTDNLVVYAGFLIEAGANLVVIGDPTATGEILGPGVFKEFALPYINQITSEVEKKYKVKSIIHICGDVKSIAGELNSVQASGVSVDAMIDLRELREKVRDKVLMGNVSTYALANSTPARVAELGCHCLKCGADILSPACGISPTTPLENLKALTKIAKESGQRNTRAEHGAPADQGTLEVRIEQDPRVFAAVAGQTIYDLAHHAHVRLNAGCGGQGTCGKCKVQVLEGPVSSVSADEAGFLTADEVAQGVRLACLTRILGPAKFRLLHQGKQAKTRILEEGRSIAHAHDPLIKKEYIRDISGGEEHRSYVDSIEHISGKKFSRENLLAILTNFPDDVRERRPDATLIIDDGKIIGIEPGDTRSAVYGIGIDIGTTTVVAALIDLATGQEVGSVSQLNTQRIHGHDVLSRIQKSRDLPGGVAVLQGLIVKVIDGLITRLTHDKGVARRDIYEIAFAGNATMLHLLLGVSPASIGRAPYTPVFRKGLKFKASALGLDIAPFGLGYCLPSVSGYVGADIVAGVLATGLNKEKEPVLFIDLGTNGEIVLAYDGKMLSCSCAAGPAWEGMNLSCGMIAAEGAIEIVAFSHDAITFQTIDGKPPVGLCGSGIIDVAAALLDAGLVNPSGRFNAGGHAGLSRKFTDTDGDLRFILVEAALSGHGHDIHVSQKDIRQVQLAKGAITSGVEVLLKEAGLDWNGLSKILIAGAFGKHVKVESLEKIGLIPKGSGDKVSFVGNTSKSGAVISLLSSEKRSEAQELAKDIRYVELSTYPGYDKIFLKELAFAAGAR